MPALVYRYSAAKAPWISSVVAVRKKVLNWRTDLPVFQPSPWVSSVPVLAGEIWVSPASLSGFCICWETLEFSGPTTPRMSLLLMNFWAFCWPTEGWAWSSAASSLNSTPLTNSVLVGGLDGQVGGVLDAEAERGEVAGGGVDTDHNCGLVAAAALAVVVTRATGGECQRSRRECGGDSDDRTLTHESGPFPGTAAPRGTHRVGRWGRNDFESAGAVTGRDSKRVEGTRRSVWPRL
ncbi:hypothetical protein SALBM311S_09222 [Streptomyces alboniger]